MYHLSTLLKPETMKKMEVIAKHFDLNKKRFAAQVIEIAVDDLFKKIATEQEAKPEAA